MTPNELITIAEWIANGVCQYCVSPDRWVDWQPSFNVSLRDNFCFYRKKPELKMRAWTQDEVPVGALYRNNSAEDGWKTIILSAGKDCIYFVKDNKITFDYLSGGCMLPNREYSIDDGKTWHPCGVFFVSNTK